MRDPLGRALTIGLALLLALSPLPFGAVGARGRGFLEAGAFVLLVLGAARALVRPPVLPSRLVLASALGLLLLGALQIVPLGSPPPSPADPEETALLGAPASSLDAAATLSVDAPATASALRTGAALVAVLLVACAVAAEGGFATVAAGLLAAAAFQALYGLAVLATGYDRIWDVPKAAYLDSATGTFVNRNHFAGFVAASLAVGLGLAIEKLPKPSAGNHRLRFDAAAGTAALGGLAALLSLSGLLLSLSRAGTALGLLAAGGVLAVATRGRLSFRARVAVASAVVAVASVPLATLGAERLVERYSESGEAIVAEGSRGDVWRDTLAIVAAHPLAGTGIGTFSAVYPSFRSPGVRLHYTHAHQDLLQLLAEGGIAAGGLLLLLGAGIARPFASAISGRRGPLAAGCAFGLAVFLAHAIVDFPFHVPANAAVAAALAGALSGLPWNGRG